MPIMKPNTLLKSLTNLLGKILSPGGATLEAVPAKPDSTNEQQLQEALQLIRAEENSGPAQFRHWGIND